MTYDETTYLAHEKLEPIKQCFSFGRMAMKTPRTEWKDWQEKETV